jgi:hypothetical protein
MATNKKTGGADFKYYEGSSFLLKLERLKDALQADLVKDLQTSHSGTEPPAFSSKDLGHLTALLQQFQEELLGVKAVNPPMVRIPSKLFKDLAPRSDSGLFVILKAAYKYRIQQGLRRWDLHTHQKAELLSTIQRALKKAGKWKVPVIAFGGAVDASSRENLQALVSRIGGK